jgi:predicted ATPase/DNA-binding XRE family transcriptional regulator
MDEVRTERPGFGRLLRRYRLAAGLSQEALAERAQMSIEGISALERGFRRSPHRETLELLAGALALDAEQRNDFQQAARTAARRKVASVTVGPWPQAGTLIVPIAVTSYVGRETDMAAIAQLLRERRFVTITGEGGIGKTRAALQAVAALDDDWEFAPCFVGLTSADAAALPRALATALGVQELPNRSLTDTLRANLENRAVLLILDNCEHVVAEAANIAEMLLTGCPSVRILATSREPLRAQGEHAYRLHGLAIPAARVPQALSVEQLLGYGAVRLFCDRARAVNHEFELTGANAHSVVELCRRLDGMPLAIELAAARANALSVAALTERLKERFALLAGGGRTAPARQQTMRATIDWSYDLLSESERRLFDRLSVFAGSCTLATVASVCDDEENDEGRVLDVLSSLVDRSLVVADCNSGEPRYHMLESFREYAAEKLATRGETEAVSRRHAVAYLEMARRVEHAADDELDSVFRKSLASELDNWRAALAWTLVARHDVRLGQELASELNIVWQLFAPVEGRRWLLGAAEEVDEQTPLELCAVLRLAQAAVAYVLGDHAEELKYANIALANYKELGDAVGTAHAQGFAGHALVYSGQSVEAIALLDEALAGARNVEVHRLVAFILRCLGRAHAGAGDYAAAERRSSEAVHIFETLGVVLPAVAARRDLAQYEFRAGKPESAVRHAAENVAIWRQANAAARPLALMLNELTAYLIALDRYDEAETCVDEGLELCFEQQLDEVVVPALQHLAALAALRDGQSTERWIRAARIMGFAGARGASAGASPSDEQRDESGRVLAALRDRIGDDAVSDAMAAGATMTQDQAIEEALSF